MSKHHKTLLVFSIFINSFLLFAFLKKPETATIKITYKYCNRPNHYLAYTDEIHIFNNNKEIPSIVSSLNETQLISGIDTGNCTIFYKTIYNQTVSQKIKIDSFKKYEIDLCIDYLDYAKDTVRPIIEQLQPNESYKIKIITRGSLTIAEDSVLIERSDSAYYIHWNNKLKTLSEKDIHAIKKLEIELRYLNGKGCTTATEYRITYKDQTTAFYDARCRWHGDEFLRFTIFGKE
jgi:hypothetical protein